MVSKLVLLLVLVLVDEIALPQERDDNAQRAIPVTTRNT